MSLSLFFYAGYETIFLVSFFHATLFHKHFLVLLVMIIVSIVVNLGFFLIFFIINNTDEYLPFQVFMYVDIFIFILKKFILLICFWLRWVSITARGLSLVAASWACSSLRYPGFSFWWLLFLWSKGSSAWASVVVTYGLSCSATRGVFLDQGWNLRRLHWQMDSYPLRHQGSPDICFLNPHFFFF